MPDIISLSAASPEPFLAHTTRCTHIHDSWVVWHWWLVLLAACLNDLEILDITAVENNVLVVDIGWWDLSLSSAKSSLSAPAFHILERELVLIRVDIDKCSHVTASIPISIVRRAGHSVLVIPDVAI